MGGKLFTSVGDYSQWIEHEGKQIIDASCTCRWDTIESSRNKFLEKKLCRHLQEALKRWWKENDKKK